MSTLVSRLSADRANVVAVVGLLGVTAYLALLVHGMSSWPYEQWMVLVLGPLLLAAGLVVIVLVTRRDEEPLTGLISLALVVKMAAALARDFVAFEVYGGAADAATYDEVGSRIATDFHEGRLPLSDLLPTTAGTDFISELTGLVYSVMGPSRLGGFLVFSWLGFWGLFLFHRAARIGLPEGDQRRYALLVFFLPSLLFWPSSIGKDALVLLALGISAYGAARVLERRHNGWVALAAGAGLAYMVRPHIAAIVLASFAVAMVFRRRSARPAVFGPLGQLLVVVLLVVVVAFTLGRAVSFLLPTADAPGIGGVLEKAEAGTEGGGSQVDSLVPNSPLDYPIALVSVLFRPTLFEIANATVAVAAVETTVLLVLFAFSWRRLRNIPLMAVRRPYVLMSIVYTGIFAFGWSSFANLGALARQRVQLWPFVLLLLAIPLVVQRRVPTARDGPVSRAGAARPDGPSPLRAAAPVGNSGSRGMRV